MTERSDEIPGRSPPANRTFGKVRVCCLLPNIKQK